MMATQLQERPTLVHLDRTLLNIKSMSLFSATGKALIDSLSFSLTAGRLTCILGQSGAGKTLLADAIMNNVPALLQLEYEQIQRPAKMALCAQSSNVLDPNLKIVELLDWYCDISMQPYKNEILEQLGIDETLLQQYPLKLSGGMGKRVLLAQAILQNPDVLVVDEPCCGLDECASASIYAFLQNFVTGQWHRKLGMQKVSPKGVLIISHNLSALLDFEAELYFMRFGKMIEKTTASAVRAGNSSEYSQALLAAVPQYWNMLPAMKSAYG